MHHGQEVRQNDNIGENINKRESEREREREREREEVSVLHRLVVGVTIC